MTVHAASQPAGLLTLPLPMKTRVIDLKSDPLNIKLELFLFFYELLNVLTPAICLDSNL